MTLFIGDENFPEPLVRMLDVFDHTNDVRHLTDYFDRGTDDVDWLKDLGQKDISPVIVSGDGKILRNAVETAQLRDANILFVMLASGWTRAVCVIN